MSDDFAWPARHHPDECPVASFNELLVQAPAEKVWAPLIRAVKWPEFYGNAWNVEIDGDREDLEPGVTFRWTTFSLRVETTVREFEPNRRLAWSGSGYGSAAYHSWTLHPRGDTCLLVTEETQRGLLPSLGRLYLRRALHRHHQAWMDGLAAVARRP